MVFKPIFALFEHFKIFEKNIEIICVYHPSLMA